MEITHTDNGTKGKFFVSGSGGEVASMTYVWAGKDRIIIDHTEVSDELRGRGAGKQMVMKAVEFARSGGLKIVPLCPFAKSVFVREKELADVL